MKEIGVDELKLIQLEMLKDIHSFCVEHDIRYSLAFGTLLGAVRHKGYIPWDDDIDIMMPRDDYNRFLQSYCNNVYKIVDISTNLYYDIPYVKVEDSRTVMDEYAECNSKYGINIDVFPVDNIPDNTLERKFLYWKKSVLNALFVLKSVRIRKGRALYKNWILIVGHFLLSPISRRYLATKMSKMSAKYEGSKTSYMGILVPADSRIEEVLPSKLFEEYVELRFEDASAMSIKGYDGYLKAAYGDYMQLPPIEKQVSHHIFSAYWKN